MGSFKFSLVMIILLSVSFQVENSKIKGCSLVGIDFQKCLNEIQTADSFESCCQPLTQAIQAGYSCLCLLLRSSKPITGISLSLTLSNCYISMPSLAQCHEPPSAVSELNHPPVSPLAVKMPPEVPINRQPHGPSAPIDFFRPFSPEVNGTPLNPPPIQNSTMAAGQTLPESGISERKEKICSSGDKSSSILYPVVLLAIALLLSRNLQFELFKNFLI